MSRFHAGNVPTKDIKDFVKEFSMVRFAVKLRNGSYLTSLDEDERIIIPLFLSKAEADEAAERSDLDSWKVVPVQLP